jgi:uncharacterized protein YndB with AHSA1/START domain
MSEESTPEDLTPEQPTPEESTPQQSSTQKSMTSPADTPTSLVVERVFPHPPEKIWRALTESPLLAQWMMNNDFQPTVGRPFQFRADPMPNWNGIVDCEVLGIDPLKSLSYSWGTGDPSAGLQWVILWTLTPVKGGTHVRMEQSGFRPGQQAAYQGANYGWQKFISGLERVLNGGAN